MYQKKKKKKKKRKEIENNEEKLKIHVAWKFKPHEIRISEKL